MYITVDNLKYMLRKTLQHIFVRLKVLYLVYL